MTPGIGIGSFVSGATFSGAGWSSAFPVTNLGDVRYPSKLAIGASAGAYAAIQVTLTAPQAIQFIGILNHNVVASAAAMRIRLYSGPTATGTPVSDSGTISFWPAGSGPALLPNGLPRYHQVRPYLLSSPVTAQTALIEIQTFDGNLLQVGGIEMSEWWAWPGVSLGLQWGVDSQEQQINYAAGGVMVPAQFSGRLAIGTIDYLVLGPATDLALDFIANRSQAQPFVFVNDYGDPTSWARKCFLAINTALPALAGSAYRADKFSFQFSEYMR